MTDTHKTPRTHKALTICATNETGIAEGEVTPATSMPTTPCEAEPLKPISKQAQLAALVTRDTGATLDQMIALTGWLPHTTRAALTGLKKKGYAISSDKVDGVRAYRAIAPDAA